MFLKMFLKDRRRRPLLLLLLLGMASGLSTTTTTTLERRNVVKTLFLSSLLGPTVAMAAEDSSSMRTSSTMGSYEEVTGETRSANLGAGSVSGKSRPETGVFLSEAPSAEGESITAELLLSKYVAARVAFRVSGGLALAKGMYYDVEARNRVGDSAYVQVVANATKSAKAQTLVDAVLASGGRYGAFGPPSDVVINSDDSNAERRLIDVSFSATSPGGSQQPRRAKIAAVTTDTTDDVILLVASASEKRWNDGGAAIADQVANSFRVDNVRPTKLLANKSNDFRFEERGGLKAITNFISPSSSKDV